MTESNPIHDKVNRALSTFAAVRKLDEKSWSDERVIEELNEAYALDDTGLTLFMLLQGMTKEFLEETSFNAEEILKDPILFGQRMAELKNLREILSDPEVTAMIAAFEQQVISNARKYGVDESTIEKIPGFLYGGVIRRDSLRSLERLEAHQFLQGKPETDHLNLNRYVWEFWNINSLVTALRDQPTPAITLTLIRDEQHTLASFFVFGIKNGENVTILTDRDEKPHPLYNSMTRRPDRDLNARELKNWFPYRLLDLKSVMGEDIFGQPIVTGYVVKDRTSLVPYDVKGSRLATIASLEPAELLWLMLTAERIDERYGKKNHQLPQLSYTGEMVVRPYALAGPEGAMVKSGTYQPIELPQLTSADVTEESTQDQWGGNRTRFNSWIEERYRDEVPDIVMNLVGTKNIAQIEERVGVRSIDRWGKQADTLTTFDPIVFGTEESIRRDVVWHARHNQMQVIDKLAFKEYQETKDELYAYWREAIEKRKDVLVRAAAAQSFLTVSRQYASESEEGDKVTTQLSSWGYIPVDTPVNLASELHTTSGFYDRETTVVFGRGKWNQDCVVNGKKGSLYCWMRPNNPRALADLLGIEESELPWQMKNWYTEEPYNGNSILDRVDPLEWVVENPWRKNRFRVVVSFSKSGLNSLRREMGLPRLDTPPQCERCYDGTPRSGNNDHCTTCGRKSRG